MVKAKTNRKSARLNKTGSISHANGDNTGGNVPLLKSGGKDEIKSVLLGTDPTRDYQSSRFSYYGELFVQQIPQWRLWTGRMMLSSDPIVGFMLNIRNAALAAGKVIVKAKDPRVQKWVQEQWDFLWNQHAPKLVEAKKWGFAPLQVQWKLDQLKDKLIIKGLKDFAPEDCRALEVSNRLVGHRVKGHKLFFPQALWIKFNAQHGSHYGTGCLRRAYPAWYEKWMDHGAKRLLQLRMIKDSYIGDIFWYPPNMLVEIPDGNGGSVKLSYRDLMRELGENRLSGGALTMPMVYDNQGKELTKYTPPQDVGYGSQIFDWNDKCDEGILWGGDVPMETVKAAETGSGYSGRSIPFLVLLSTCTQEFKDIVQSVDHQVLRPGAWLNFGGEPDYQIEVVSLVESFTDGTSGSPMGGGALGGQPSTQAQQVEQQQLPPESSGKGVQYGEKEDNDKLYRSIPNAAFEGNGSHPIPLHRLHLHKKQVEGTLKDIKEGRKSKQGNRPVELFYNTKHKQFNVQDGLHRIMEAHQRGDTHIHAVFEAGDKHELFHPVSNKDRYKLHSQHSEDQLPGGKGDRANPKDFDKESIAMGMKVEMEHTSDPKVALEIALDHLTEDKDYYTKLKKAGLADELKDSQHSESAFQARRGILEKHGWKPFNNSTTYNLWEHKDRPNHLIQLRNRGIWKHINKNVVVGDKYKVEGEGRYHEALDSHLIAHHSSQHVEGGFYTVGDKQAEEHKFSSTQFNLPPELGWEVWQLGHRIAAEDLIERENQPHVTVKYGLHTNDGEEVRKLVQDQFPVAIQLGKCSFFSGEESDVVKIDVESKALHALNKHISDSLEVTDTYPDYKPHVTIAYVKKGLGEYYSKRLNDLEGRVAVFDRLLFSNKTREHTPIQLTGQAQFQDGGIPSNGANFQGLTFSELFKGKDSEPHGLGESDKLKHLNNIRKNKEGNPDIDHDDFNQLGTTKSIPISSIKSASGQGTVSRKIVNQYKKKLRAKETVHPVHVVHHAGIHHLGEGHHRVVAAKELGHTHIQAKVLDADEHQHSEELVIQFDEAEAIVKLREFIAKGMAAKVKLAQERIRKLGEAAIDLPTLAGLIEREITSLGPLLAPDLAASGLYAKAKGVLDVADSLPKPVEPPGRPLESTVKAPDIKAVLGGEVELPQLDTVLERLERSPVARGSNYLETVEHVRTGAFAITTELSEKAVIDVKDLLTETVREGNTKEEFIEAVVTKLGADKFSTPHLENILRTNQASLYSDARMEAMGHDLVIDAFPYVTYWATNDARTRPNHKALERLGLDGTNIYRTDDPVFKKFRPPWDYQCRCSWHGTSVEQAARKGVKEASEWWDKAKEMAKQQGGSAYQYLAIVKPSNPQYVTQPDFEPSEGFKRDQA